VIYVVSNSVLADYEYVQQCLNLDHDIKFVIVHVDSIPKPFQRTVSALDNHHLHACGIIFIHWCAKSSSELETDKHNYWVTYLNRYIEQYWH